MNCAPTSGAPSSPDSARKMTSRSSAALVALQRQHQHQAGDQVVLVVHRAAAVDVAAVDVGAERAVVVHFFGSIVTTSVWPSTRIGRFLPLPLMRATRLARFAIAREHLIRDAFLVEHLLQVLDRLRLVARRAAGVDAGPAPGNAAASRPRPPSSQSAPAPGRCRWRSVRSKVVMIGIHFMTNVCSWGSQRILAPVPENEEQIAERPHAGGRRGAGLQPRRDCSIGDREAPDAVVVMQTLVADRIEQFDLEPVSRPRSRPWPAASRRT